MQREALGAGQCSDRRGELPGGLLCEIDRRDAAPEDVRSQWPLESAGAARRKDVVRPGGVVAERSGPALADEHAARGRRGVREKRGVLGDQLQVLRGDRVRKLHRGDRVGHRDQRKGRVRGDPTLLGHPLHRILDRVEDHRLDGRGDHESVRAVLGLGTEVEGDPLRPRRVAGDHHQLRGSRDAVDADLPHQLALGLLDIAVAGARDHVDRLDHLRPDRQSGDRLGAAERVDLIRASDRRRREDQVRDRPFTLRGRSGEHDAADACDLRR